MTQHKATRTERDTMGEMQVPADAYYGGLHPARGAQLSHQ